MLNIRSLPPTEVTFGLFHLLSATSGLVTLVPGPDELFACFTWVGPQPRDPVVYTVTVGPYVIAFQSLETQEPPLRYTWAKQHAELLEEFDLQGSDGDFCYLVVGRSIDRPTLVLAQRHDPAEDAGFYPGVLVVPETDVLFVGAGERLLAYDLAHPARLWEDVADYFCRWARYDEVVIMEAELELAAWNLEGTKLWTTVVEPPWSYEVTDDVLKLDIMGIKSEFSLGRGPAF